MKDRSVEGKLAPGDLLAVSSDHGAKVGFVLLIAVNAVIPQSNSRGFTIRNLNRHEVGAMKDDYSFSAALIGKDMPVNGCPTFVSPNSDISILPSAPFVRKLSEDLRDTMGARRRMRGVLITKGHLGAANQRIKTRANQVNVYHALDGIASIFASILWASQLCGAACQWPNSCPLMT